MSAVMVISNHPDLADEIRPFGVPYFHIPATRNNRAEAEQRQLELLRGNVDLVVLARYMQIIGPGFLTAVGCPLINIHHSFLPAMQQRVAIARAIAYEPRVLLMDEPFAAVDAQTRADLEDLIRDLWHRFRVTTLFVTHDIDEAVYLGQRVIILSNSPTVIRQDLTIDLPDERDQLHTRSSHRFGELRAQVYSQIHRPRAESPERAATAAGAPH